MAKTRGGHDAAGGRPDAGSTAATAALRAAGVAFTERTYTHDPGASSYGGEAATRLGVDPRRVYKTIVLAGGDVLAVAIVPVSGRVDTKAAAAALNLKRLDLADPTTAERSTGYVVGGISPFGQRRALPTVLDAGALAFETIFVSGGRRGFDVGIDPRDLVRVLSARTASIARA